MENIIRRFGWLPDLPDMRDLVGLPAKLLKLEKPLLARVDRRDECSETKDQTIFGSCVGHASSSALEFLDIKFDGYYTSLSPMFLYYCLRLMEGTVNSDSGASIRDAIKLINNPGICSEALWPYGKKWSDFTRPPTARCYKDAWNHKAVEYRHLSTIQEIKSALAGGYPVVFGMSVYESFNYGSTARTGIVPMPSRSEVMLGGHAVYMAGYDDSEKHFICMNSWGKDWGISGSFYLPYEYLLNGLADDFWMISKINYND